ncbi:MAG: efflux RND transporter periplasmic adaptor subunit [Pseudomonadota bacterium]
MKNIVPSEGGTRRKQATTIAAILLVALIAAVFILLSPTSGGAEVHADEDHAGEPHAEGKPPAAPHGDEKIAFSDTQLAASGISLESAGPARIQSSLQLPGEIRFNEDRTAHVVPRVAGVVDQVSANLGEQVKKGQVLAVLSSASLSEQRSELLSAQKRLQLARTTAERERRLWQDRISAEQDYLQAEQALREAEIATANAGQKLLAQGASAGTAALARYELRAPFDGMVVEKHLALGESVKEDSNVFTLSDLSTVWAEISVSAGNLPLVRVGDSVSIRSSSFDQRATGKVSFVGSLLGEQTRTATARVTLANPALVWRPGLFVSVELVSSEADLPVTVSVDAVQTLDQKPVVFVQVPGGFQAQAVEVGRSDGRRVEIVRGLQPGARLAGAGSFLVKAQQGKGSAAHTH